MKFFIVASTGIIIGMMIGSRINYVLTVVGGQAGFLISYFVLRKCGGNENGWL